jgi:hypothetical protein
MPNHFTTMAVCYPGHDFNVHEFNDRHAESNLCAVVRPMPEPVDQVRSVYYPDGTTEKERQGVDQDWYDWAKENWGTKWGTYGVKAFELGGDGRPILIKFQSAWGPPSILNEISSWLKRTQGFEVISWVGFDPYDDSTSMLHSEKYGDHAPGAEE